MKRNDKNTPIQELKDLLLEFREKREWKQFHNPKDLAEAISIEASELLELFLWKTKEEINSELNKNSKYKKEIEDELADVVSFCFNFANSIDIDISIAVKNKIEKNNKKYTEDKARGIATKYNKL